MQEKLEAIFSVFGEQVTIKHDNSKPEIYEVITNDYGVFWVCAKNLTFGGRENLDDEQRIQIKGESNNFIESKLIGGFKGFLLGLINCDGVDILCTFKVKHSNALNTISKQIKIGTINKALKEGFAQQPKNGEYACAFRKEFLYFYLNNIEWIHDDLSRNLNNHVNIEESIVENDVINDKENHNSSGRNIILYGVPGVGKSHEIKENYCKGVGENFIERVVFHPDYTYSDFVGQILPTYDEVTDKLKYVFCRGPFTNILEKACKDPDNSYFLIIEEINRGNAPAIFGDIFQLLDRCEVDSPDGTLKTGDSEYGVTNFDIAREVYKDANHKVRIPSNLTLIATMNTADQNVFTLDTAFQRRWEMRHIKNDIKSASHANSSICDSYITWAAFVDVVNEQIVKSGNSMISSGDKRIGAYFALESEISDSKKFSEKVLKYLWDDAVKLDHSKLFKNEFSTADEMIEAFEDKTGDASFENIFNQDVFQQMKDRVNRYLTNSVVEGQSEVDDETE